MKKFFLTQKIASGSGALSPARLEFCPDIWNNSCVVFLYGKLPIIERNQILEAPYG